MYISFMSSLYGVHQFSNNLLIYLTIKISAGVSGTKRVRLARRILRREQERRAMCTRST
jgi:hypothetical protein